MLLQMLASGRWFQTHCGVIRPGVNEEVQMIEEEEEEEVEKRAQSARVVQFR